MSMELSEHAAFTIIETADIGGTSASTAYVAMTNFARVMAYAEIGTWDSGDDLDTAKLQQATDSSGTSVKDLTTSASGGDYDTDTDALDADGDFVVIEARAEELDADNGFDYVRLTLAEAGNTGVDNVTAFLIRYGYHYPQKELNGAAVSGSKVYVRQS